LSLNAKIVTAAKTLWASTTTARTMLTQQYYIPLSAKITTPAKTLWASTTTARTAIVQQYYIPLSAKITTAAKTLWASMTTARTALSQQYFAELKAKIVSSAKDLWASFTTARTQLKSAYAVDLTGKINIDFNAAAKDLWDKFVSAWDKAKKDLTVTVVAKTSGFDIDRTGGGSTRGGGAGRAFIVKARGGIIPDGMRGMIRNIPQYARGTLAAHGTMFVAGENGPEIMGHINGKTEILNRSQIAAAMYAATTRALHNVQYRAPAMASGSVLPYAVAAQYARETERLQNTIEASNEDMTQAVIGAISSAALAIVGAVQKYGGGDGGFGGLNAQNVIDEINRRTNMYNRSPLKG
jgi:hypothetical protein